MCWFDLLWPLIYLLTHCEYQDFLFMYQFPSNSFYQFLLLQSFNLISYASVLSDSLTHCFTKRIKVTTLVTTWPIYCLYYSQVPFIDIHLSSLLPFLFEEDVPCLRFMANDNPFAPPRPSSLLIYSIFSLSTSKLFFPITTNVQRSHLPFTVARILD